MPEEPEVFTVAEVATALMDAARGPSAGAAIAHLTALIQQAGGELTDLELAELARTDSYADPAVDLSGLRPAIEVEMRRRGLWDSFRRQERIRVWTSGIRWLVSILAISAGALAALFGAIIGLKWVLYWMGF